MADKSPRKTASKKSGKTIKEKRQAKKEKQLTNKTLVSRQLVSDTGACSHAGPFGTARLVSLGRTLLSTRPAPTGGRHDHEDGQVGSYNSR